VGIVQRTPEGLLDLVGTSVGGRYPTGFSDTVAPTLDISELLRGRILANEGQIVAADSSLGATATITVPEGQVWLLYNVSVTCVRGTATQRVAYKIILRNLPGSTAPANEVPLLQTQMPAVANQATAEIGFTHNLPQLVALPAGAVIEAEVTDTTTNGLNWSLLVGLFKLKD